MTSAGITSGQRLGIVGAALFALALVLAVVGSFLPLVTAAFNITLRDRATVTVNSWGQSIDAPGGGPPVAFADAAAFGVPLVVAAVILLAAALLGLVAARPAAAPAAGRAVLPVGLFAAAFLTGIVWAVAAQASATSDTFTTVSPVVNNRNFGFEAGLGAGYWLLIAAAVVSLAAAVVTAGGARRA